ncbi:MAG: DUF1843 domain-containing protein [Candidatus Eremiobacteraeota bacterium]|nr:DUF1843 domain-containing protein [Candidatus Eremiobacteraeota bacterium]
MSDLGPQSDPAAFVQPVDVESAHVVEDVSAMEAGGTPVGPHPPYGPPIHAAAKRGDLAEMESVAVAAKLALAAGNPDYAGISRGLRAVPGGQSFSPVTSDNEGAVIAALAHLELAIERLKSQQGSQ